MSSAVDRSQNLPTDAASLRALLLAALDAQAATAAERDILVAERDCVAAERDIIVVERTNLTAERDELARQNGKRCPVALLPVFA